MKFEAVPIHFSSDVFGLLSSKNFALYGVTANAVNTEKHQTRSRRKRPKKGNELEWRWVTPVCSIGSNSVVDKEYCFETVEVDDTQVCFQLHKRCERQCYFLEDLQQRLMSVNSLPPQRRTWTVPGQTKGSRRSSVDHSIETKWKRQILCCGNLSEICAGVQL